MNEAAIYVFVFAFVRVPKLKRFDFFKTQVNMSHVTFVGPWTQYN